MNGLEKIVKGIAKYVYVGFPVYIPATISAFEANFYLNHAELHEAKSAIAGVVFCLGLGAHKYAEYRKVKKALEKRGWDERIVRPKSYSFCQRHAIKQAVRDTGHVREYSAFCKKEGHRFYHVLPKVHRIGQWYKSINTEYDLNHPKEIKKDITSF